jgi:cysteine desulfurase
LMDDFNTQESRLLDLFSMNSSDRYIITSCWEDIPRAVVRSSGCKKIGVFLSDCSATLGACDGARGDIQVEYFRELPRSVDNALLFLQYVHPLTGAVISDDEILSWKSKGCLIALDVSYALGKIPLDHVIAHADYVMVRGDALGVPFGLSCVCARDGAFLMKRDVSLVSMKAFVSSVEKELAQELFYTTEVIRLREMFEEGESVVLKEQKRAPHISCIAFPGIKNELLLFTLARRGVFATMGGGPFPLFERMFPLDGTGSLEAMTALSFCFGGDICEKDVVEAKVRLRRAVKELRVISEDL